MGSFPRRDSGRSTYISAGAESADIPYFEIDRQSCILNSIRG